MEEEGRNTSEAWGLPISNVDTFSNLTDSQFLVRVLGPKHMGYEVMCIPSYPQSSCHGCRQNFHKTMPGIWIMWVTYACVGMNEVNDEELECCD